MSDILGVFQQVINLLNNMEAAGVSMITWIVIVIVISGIGFIIRGNK